mmetsp:Transcript_70205/g.187071  ORF Transcript_70205/g.187071 Transcript_70205/m.187071 type:complete len:258 (+) Transcript_70205:795-1568(+)
MAMKAMMLHLAAIQSRSKATMLSPVRTPTRSKATLRMAKVPLAVRRGPGERGMDRASTSRGNTAQTTSSSSRKRAAMRGVMRRRGGCTTLSRPSKARRKRDRPVRKEAATAASEAQVERAAAAILKGPNEAPRGPARTRLMPLPPAIEGRARVTVGRVSQAPPAPKLRAVRCPCRIALVRVGPSVAEATRRRTEAELLDPARIGQNRRIWTWGLGPLKEVVAVVSMAGMPMEAKPETKMQALGRHLTGATEARANNR